VIGYVIAALRIVRHPRRPAALHAFAQIVLSKHFCRKSRRRSTMQAVPRLAPRPRLPRPREHPDTKNLCG